MFCTVFAVCAANPSQLKGQIVENFAGGAPIADVQVSASGANPTRTDSFGMFSLTFRAPPGTAVKPVFLWKGWVVVNAEVVNAAVLTVNPDEHILRVIMSKSSEREKYAAVFNSINIERTAGAALRGRAASASSSRATLAQADALASDLARADGSARTALATQAIVELLKGNLDTALSILNREKLRDGDSPKPLSDAQIGQHLLRAQTLAISQQFDQAERAYTDLASAAPKSYRAQFALGSFEFDMGRNRKAQLQFESSLPLAREAANKGDVQSAADLGTTLALLADAERRLGDFAKAEAHYEEAITIRRKLAATDPSAYRYSLASTLTHFGALKIQRGQYDQAGAMLGEAWNAFVTKDAGSYRPAVATLLNTRGTLYLAMGDARSARATLAQALEIRAALARENPELYGQSYAESLNNLCVVERTSVKPCDDAVAKFRELVKAKPEIFRPALATALHNRGKAAQQAQDDISAERYYQQALDIRRELARDGTAGSLGDAAKTLNFLAGIWMESGRLNQAGEGYREVLQLYDQASATSPSRYQAYVAASLFNLAVLFSKQRRFEEANETCRKLSGLYLELSAYATECNGPDNERMRSFIQQQTALADRAE